MDVGDIVSVYSHSGDVRAFGVIIEPYARLGGAWYVDILLGNRTFSKLAYWNHQLKVVEEAP